MAFGLLFVLLVHFFLVCALFGCEDKIIGKSFRMESGKR